LAASKTTTCRFPLLSCLEVETFAFAIAEIAGCPREQTQKCDRFWEEGISMRSL
jgi:hypothetical protein